MVQLGGKQVVKSVCCVLQGEEWWFSWEVNRLLKVYVVCCRERSGGSAGRRGPRVLQRDPRQPLGRRRRRPVSRGAAPGKQHHQQQRVRGHHITRGQGQSGVTTSSGGKVSQGVTMGQGQSGGHLVTRGKVSQWVTRGQGQGCRT